MAEKCLMVTTLAVLLFHPSSTIRCFRPNSDSTSPQGNSLRRNPRPINPQEEKKSKKSRKKLDFPSNNYLSRTSNSPLTLSPKTKRIALSEEFREVVTGEQLYNVVEAIFQSGWTCKKGPIIEKILKVNHNEEVLDRLEAHREQVKSGARKNNYSNRMERFVIDGNELLQFHGTTVTCKLGFNEVLNICKKKSCGICRMIRFSDMDKVKPVLFYETSWAAHEKLSGKIGVNGRSERKVMVICRVIAGRVANYHRRKKNNREENEFESVVVSTGNPSNGGEGLVVLNPRAILPCFVVMYNVL